MLTPQRIHTRVRVEIEPIKGSRFIATLIPAAEEGDAEAALDAIREEMPDATHHCWAWRALRGGLERCSDDGEPSGTAGRPILARLSGAELACALLVVTRYYGGTKLGTGGLVRAYGAAASAVLDAATLTPHVDTTPLRVTFDYPHQHAVEQALEAVEAEITERRFTARVSFDVELPVAHLEAATQGLADATHGGALIEEMGDEA